MSGPDLAGWVLLAAGAGLALVLLLLARRWSVGRPAGVAWLAGLRRLPRAYLHDVHEVVAREPAAARMHALAAGGLLAALILSLPLHLLGAAPAVLAPLVLLAVAASLAGAALSAQRRLIRRLPRLSPSGYDRLAFLLAAVLLFLGGAALGRLLGLEGWGEALLALFGLAAFGGLLWAAWRGPMKHAVAGALHLMAHPRPRRLETGRDVALRPLDLAAPKLGAESFQDLPWNRLLSFDACVQCGRCEAVCPAHAAGQPLNPKRLIGGLAAQLAEGRPLEVAPEVLWACTTCRACVRECPMLIEHVDAIVELRRFQTLELGAAPPKVAEVLDNLRLTDTQGGQGTASRLDWAADLALPLLSDRGGCDTLLWLGEGAFELRNRRTLRALVQLLRRAGVDFAVLGEEELDSGDIARRSGDEATFAELARRNVATLARYRFRRIVTADPHAFNILKNEYPDFGGRYEVLHHSTLLAELLADGELRAGPLAAGSVTFHDPCYLGRYNGEVEAPRRLLRALGVEATEMERAGLRSNCCGGGGGAPLSAVPGRRQIAESRMDQVRATGAGTVVVACPQCAVMLESVSAPRPAVVDLAELVLQATEPRG